MKMNISNITVKDLPQQFKVPKDTNIIKEWLDDYKIEYVNTDEELIKIYIRAAMLDHFDLDYTISTLDPLDAVQPNIEQPFCIDIVDQEYDEYITVNAKCDWPDNVSHDIPDDFFDIHFDDDNLAVFDFLRHYLPVTITIEK